LGIHTKDLDVIIFGISEGFLGEMSVGEMYAFIRRVLVVNLKRNSEETVMVVDDEGIGRSDQHVDSEVEFVVVIEEEGVGDVGLGNDGLVLITTSGTVVVEFFPEFSFVLVENEDSLSSVGTITELNNELDRFLFKTLNVCLRVDLLKEGFTFFLDVKSVGIWEEFVLVEAVR
jgi:hypothetical protein